MPNKVSSTVESSLGKVSIDSDGSPIGVVRMAPEITPSNSRIAPEIY